MVIRVRQLAQARLSVIAGRAGKIRLRDVEGAALQQILEVEARESRSPDAIGMVGATSTAV